MPKTIPALLPSEPDPAILANMAKVERVCLTVLLLGIAANATGWLFPALEQVLPNCWRPMKTESLLAVLLSALCLILSEAGQPKWMKLLGMFLAAMVGLGAAAVLIAHRFDLSADVDLLRQYPAGVSILGRMSLQSASGFLLLSGAMMLTRARSYLALRIADGFTFGVCLTVLTLVSGHLFGTFRLFGVSTDIPASPQTLFCLVLLATVVVLRRSENGVFSIFTGIGNGGRLARLLTPILLVLPFLREGARARILGGDRMPPYYLSAMLASLAAMVSIALLLYLAWRINGMETEIQVLTLRDELTGLYNLRGFQLLAEQALRLAQRSKLPFSVLYLDLDNLKQTNDLLGHQAGSQFLVETSEMLRVTFRETDVLGRLGGDEFAVAGHFNQATVLAATRRLEAFCAVKNAEQGREFVVSLSVGHVTSLAAGKETLNQLLADADHAMYKVKRSKKDPLPEREAMPALGEQGSRSA